MSTDMNNPKKEDITHGAPKPNQNEPNTKDPKKSEIKEPSNSPRSGSPTH